jgi:hypothetical protein
MGPVLLSFLSLSSRVAFLVMVAFPVCLELGIFGMAEQARYGW